MNRLYTVIILTHRFVLDDLVAGDRLGLCVYFVSDVLGSRPTIGYVILDSKIVVRTTRVVAGGQEDTTISFVLPDNIGSSRG